MPVLKHTKGGSKGNQSSLQSAAHGRKYAAGKQGYTTPKTVADAAAQATITGPTNYTRKGGDLQPKSSLAAVSYAETVSTTSLSSQLTLRQLPLRVKAQVSQPTLKGDPLGTRV